MSVAVRNLAATGTARNRLIAVKLGLGSLTGDVMQVREFMSSNIGVCVLESSCTKAGEIMRRHQCGSLAVVDNLKTRRMVGMITDRDIMLHLIQAHLSASQAWVKDCMAPAPMMISVEADLDVAIRVMKKEGMYQLPVIEDGRLVGALSLEDIALAARRQWAYVGPHATEQHVTEILEAIAIARERRKKIARY